MSFYFVLNDHHPTIRKIFQKSANLIPHFQLGPFHFELFDALDDFCTYHVRCGDFKKTINFFDIDAVDLSFCNFRSNVDFVHFVWENYDKFPVQKFAITILPQDDAPVPFRLEDTRLLYLEHYRAPSDGWWKDRENCVQCVGDFHTSLLALCACQLRRDDCPCIVCRRQPPYLRDICSNAYFLNLPDFELNSHTTFQRYVYAVNSGLVSTRKLLPPDFPTIQLVFYHDTFETKTHADCPGGQSWQGTLQRDFDIPADAILALLDEN